MEAGEANRGWPFAICGLRAIFAAICDEPRPAVPLETEGVSSAAVKPMSIVTKKGDAGTTALMYGDLQGIVGQTTLPEIKTLELTGGE